ncbi:MAG: GNAT family N-acetyltransferase [Actinomycetota bacterium]|nr:GNAT family N-acetyltransferase [Actinomycetota bacterium]
MPGSRRRGRHVHIRPLLLDDEAEFLRLVRASRVLHRPWSYPPATRQAFREHVGDGGDSDARFVVCRNDDGAIVGYFGLGQIFYGRFRNAYLGYYAFEPFAGQGYMREGLELVLRYAFGDLHLHRVQASIQPGNERSIALVRGAGFRKEGLARRYLKIGGRWRDHEQWALTVEDGHEGHRST